jgi:hypothetical protein
MPRSVETRRNLESVTVDLLTLVFPLEAAVRLFGVSITGCSVGELRASCVGFLKLQ